MIWIIVSLVVAIFVDRVQLKLGAATYRSVYNGHGAIDSVLQRKALAPMAYRVLVPLVVGVVERFFPRLSKNRIQNIYEPIKVFGIFVLVYVCGVYFGYTTALLMAALMGATFYFDYWDWAFEAMGVLFAMTGDPYLYLAGALMWAMSKETAPLAPFIYLASTYDFGLFAVGMGLVVAIMFLVRYIVGKREMYCPRMMWRINLTDVKELFENVPFYSSEIFISLAITVISIGSLIVNPSLVGLYIVPMLVAGWVMARSAETRVFFVCLIYPCITAGKLLS